MILSLLLDSSSFAGGGGGGRVVIEAGIMGGNFWKPMHAKCSWFVFLGNL